MITAAHAEPANNQPELSLLTEVEDHLAEKRYEQAADLFMQAAARLDESNVSALEQKKEALRLAGENYYAANELTQSLEAYQQCLKLEDKSTDPLAWADAAESLVVAHLRVENYALAESLLNEILRIQQQERGQEDPRVSVALNNLAHLLYETNRLEEAESLMRRALAIDEAHFGPMHFMVAIRLCNLAKLLQATNRLQEAEALYRRALAIHEASYGPEHPIVAIHLNNLAELLQAMGRYQEAQPLYQRDLKISLRFQWETGEDLPQSQLTLTNYEMLLMQMGQTQEEAQASIAALQREVREQWEQEQAEAAK